jgi:2-dehydropantoate 2-reductase
VLSPRGDFTAMTPATDDPSQVGPVDFVFLGLKANAYGSCGPLIGPLLHEGTAIVAAQNGIPWWYFHGLSGQYEGRRVHSVDPGGVVTRALPLERVIGCVVYCSTEVEGPGVIRHLGGTRFSIGEPDGSISERCLAFSEAMTAGVSRAPSRPTSVRTSGSSCSATLRSTPSARWQGRRWWRSPPTPAPGRRCV